MLAIARCDEKIFREDLPINKSAASWVYDFSIKIYIAIMHVLFLCHAEREIMLRATVQRHKNVF